MILLLSLIFILGTKCFGFAHNIEILKIPGLGVLNLGHVLMLIAYAFAIMKGKPKRIRIFDPILLPVFLLLLLFCFELIRNIILVDLDVKSMIRCLKHLYMLFYIFPLIMLIRNKQSLMRFINILQ